MKWINKSIVMYSSNFIILYFNKVVRYIKVKSHSFCFFFLVYFLHFTSFIPEYLFFRYTLLIKHSVVSIQYVRAMFERFGFVNSRQHIWRIQLKLSWKMIRRQIRRGLKFLKLKQLFVAFSCSIRFEILDNLVASECMSVKLKENPVVSSQRSVSVQM